MAAVSYKSKEITVSGICSALTLILMWFAGILPSGKISMLFAVSVLIPILLINFNTRTAFISYTVSCILCFLFVANKSISIAYILIFGNYGLIKYFIEKKNNLILEYILKTIYFNLVMVVYYLIAKYIIGLAIINIDNKILLGLLLYQCIWVISDWIYSLAIKESIQITKKILKS